ncbi:MAG: hypothetical protein RLY86_2360 [Pseudomonadota bacterium]|jgi:hypothetical protein
MPALSPTLPFQTVPPRTLPSLVAALLALVLAGCAAAPRDGTVATTAAPVAPTAQTAPAPDPAALYQAALRDSAVPEPADVYGGLLALVRSTPGLEWEGPGPDARVPDARVKVASLMSEQAFQKYYAAPPDDRVNGDAWGIIWVTPVPQLRTLCQAVPGDTTTKVERLKQWLGLQPTGSYARVVEMWVRPDQLARPCPDPEVTDGACTLDTAKAGPGVDAGYVAWFAANYQPSYRYNGFPWTRLGYTYDWAPPGDTVNPLRPVGGSEYIFAPKAAYTISGRYTVQEYCGG